MSWGSGGSKVQAVPFRGPEVLYDSRSSLRSMSPSDGSLILVESIGLFRWYLGNSSIDNDVTCFATASGAWLLYCPHPDYVSTHFALLNSSNSFADNQISRAMLVDCGYTVYDKGTVSSGTATFDYTAGSVQTWTSGGAHTVATSNWPPTCNLGEMLLIGTNLGSAAITWPSWIWTLPDGTTTTSIATFLAANGTRTALQTSGTDKILLISRDSGTTVYASLLPL